MAAQHPIDTTDGDYDEAWALAMRYLDLAEAEGCRGRVTAEPMTRATRGGHRHRTGYAVYLTLTDVPEGAAQRLGEKIAWLRTGSRRAC
jgi:hypothetical protein